MSFSSLPGISCVFYQNIPRWFIRRVQRTRCKLSHFIYFCTKVYMFQVVFQSIIRSSELHIQSQVLIWQIPDAVCAILSSWWWTEKTSETCRVSYRNILWNVASFWLYSANVLAMHRPMNVKFSAEFCSRCLHPTFRPSGNKSKLLPNRKQSIRI